MSEWAYRLLAREDPPRQDVGEGVGVGVGVGVGEGESVRRTDFLRERTPGRMHVPSSPTAMPHELATVVEAVGDEERKVACSLSTSTMNSNTSSSSCSTAASF